MGGGDHCVMDTDFRNGHGDMNSNSVKDCISHTRGKGMNPSNLRPAMGT